MPLIPTYYVQACPVCGRSLHVPVQLLGQAAACQHCRATFVAHDPHAAHRQSTILSERVDTLLSRYQRMPSMRSRFVSDDF